MFVKQDLSLNVVPVIAVKAVIFAGLLSAACTIEEKQPLSKIEQTMEPIGNSGFDGKMIHFQALSNGCTRSEHFSLSYAINESRCELTVIRNQPDNCRMAAHLGDYSLEWSRPDNCSGMPVVVINPKIKAPAPRIEERLPE